MNRIAVIGCSGSGKSTLSTTLSHITGLPVVHLDRLYWRPGWVAAPWDWVREQVAQIVQQPRWILDGNFGRVQDLTLSAAEVIVWLDLPRWMCMSRIFRRLIEHNGFTRPDLPDGCPEKVDLEFMQWVWNFRKGERPKIISNLSKLRPDQRLIALRTPGEVDEFVREMRESACHCSTPVSSAG